MPKNPNQPKCLPTGDYPVGFARPPSEHNFPKGKSGNPKGRPKKDPDAPLMAPDHLKTLLEQPLVVQKNGVPQKLSPVEARILSMIKKALTQKSIRAIKYILSRALKYGIIELPKPKQGGGVVIIPRMEGIPKGMEQMLTKRFGIPKDGKWLPEEIELVRPHFEQRKAREEEELRQRYRKEFESRKHYDRR